MKSPDVYTYLYKIVQSICLGLGKFTVFHISQYLEWSSWVVVMVVLVGLHIQIHNNPIWRYGLPEAELRFLQNRVQVDSLIMIVMSWLW